MKSSKKIIAFFIALCTSIIHTYGCTCYFKTSPERDSIFTPHNLAENYPIIFTGKYIGWDYWGLRVFEVLKSYKGLDDNTKYFTMAKHTCELEERIGDTVLVSAYFNSGHSPFMSFGGCTGSLVLNKKSSNYRRYGKTLLAYLEKNLLQTKKSKLNPRKETIINICKNYDFTLRSSNSQITSTRDHLEKHSIPKPKTILKTTYIHKWQNTVLYSICSFILGVTSIVMLNKYIFRKND